MTQPTPDIQTQQVTVNGLPIYTRSLQPPASAPNAPVFVLIHGLLIASRYMLPTAERLGKRYPVYLPDLPGFGGSADPSHVYSLQEQADAIVGWLDALALPPAIFLGNSLSCQVLVDLAVRYPARVQALILTAPTVDLYAHSFFQQFVRLLSDGPREDPRILLPMLLDFFRGGPGRAIRTFRYALADPLAEKLTRVAAPTLIVRGERDPIVSQRWVEEATRLLPNGQLQVLANAPHCVTFSTPAALIAAVVPFVQSLKMDFTKDDFATERAANRISTGQSPDLL